MHRLQAVADIGQRAADDHAHRVIEIRPPHLVFDVDGNDVLSAVRHRRAATGAGGAPAAGFPGLASVLLNWCKFHFNMDIRLECTWNCKP